MSGVEICPNIDRHTPSPAGYVDRLTWMGRMHSAGAIQTRCPDCGLWAIWTSPVRGPMVEIFKAGEYPEKGCLTCCTTPPPEPPATAILNAAAAVAEVRGAHHLTQRLDQLIRELRPPRSTP